jgi:hypothetical protein
MSVLPNQQMCLVINRRAICTAVPAMQGVFVPTWQTDLAGRLPRLEADDARVVGKVHMACCRAHPRGDRACRCWLSSPSLPRSGLARGKQRQARLCRSSAPPSTPLRSPGSRQAPTWRGRSSLPIRARSPASESWRADRSAAPRAPLAASFLIGRRRCCRTAKRR